MTSDQRHSLRGAGGSFLIRNADLSECFTPEELTEEHQAVAQTTEEFFRTQLAGQPKAGHRRILRQSADLGLNAVLIPESVGGMDLDLISAAIVADRLAGEALYALRHNDHSGTSTLPLLWYGSPERQQRYLKRIAGGELVAAHCYPDFRGELFSTVASATRKGSDYVLNADGLRCRNANIADVVTIVAATSEGEKTAFLVETGAKGVHTDTEGSLKLESVVVSAEQMLGGTGRGEEIADHALGLERLLLAHAAAGGTRTVAYDLIGLLEGRDLAGPSAALLRELVATAAMHAFVAESAAYRLTGLIQTQVAAGVDLPEALAEYDTEAALAWSVTLGELVACLQFAAQIRGQLGFAPASRNEKNWRKALEREPLSGASSHVLAARSLIDRSRDGRLPLPAAIEALNAELLDLPAHVSPADPLIDTAALVANTKKTVLLAFSAAFRHYGPELDHDAQVVAAVGELAALAFRSESAALRAGKLISTQVSGPWGDIARTYAQQTLDVCQSRARSLLGSCCAGDELRTKLALLRRLWNPEPVDRLAAVSRIADYLLQTPPTKA